MNLKKAKKLVSYFLAVVAVLFIAGQGSIVAAGLSFTPAYSRITIPKGQNIQYASFAVKNDTATTVRLKASATDVDLTSSTLMPLETTASAATKSVTVTNPSIVLPSNKSVNLIAKIDGSNLPPGGHYTGITVVQLTDSLNKNVPIKQAVNIGLFIVKEEGAERSLNLDSKLLSGLHLSPPKSLDLSFIAKGNVEITPRAAVTILEGDEVLAKATINDISKRMQPGDRLNFPVNFSYQKALTPGKHTISVSYRYEGQEKPIIKQATFWYVPVWYVLLFVLGIMALAFFTRRYTKPIASQASQMLHQVIDLSQNTPHVVPPESNEIDNSNASAAKPPKQIKKPRKKPVKKSK